MQGRRVPRVRSDLPIPTRMPTHRVLNVAPTTDFRSRTLKLAMSLSVSFKQFVLTDY